MTHEKLRSYWRIVNIALLHNPQPSAPSVIGGLHEVIWVIQQAEAAAFAQLALRWMTSLQTWLVITLTLDRGDSLGLELFLRLPVSRSAHEATIHH